MITYIDNKPTSAKAIADMRESIGWNRMEAEEKLKSFYSRFGFFDMLCSQMQTYESE